MYMYLLNLRNRQVSDVRYSAHATDASSTVDDGARPTHTPSAVVTSAVLVAAVVAGIYGANRLTETPIPGTFGTYEPTTSDR
jgi:hypothetical protein